jgi:hypothetical protein
VKSKDAPHSVRFHPLIVTISISIKILTISHHSSFINTKRSLLIPTYNSPFEIFPDPRCIDNLNALPKPNHIAALPPPVPASVSAFRFGIASLVIRVYQTSEAGAVTADNDDDLAYPGFDLLDVDAVVTAERFYHVYKIWRQVPQHVHVTCGCREWHNHRGILNQSQCLRMQRVPE